MLLQNVLPSRCKVGISWTPSVPVSDNGFQVVLWNFEWWPRWAWEKHGATSAVQRPTSIHCPNILGGLACDYCNNAILLPIETPCKGHATEREKKQLGSSYSLINHGILWTKNETILCCVLFQWCAASLTCKVHCELNELAVSSDVSVRITDSLTPIYLPLS